MIPTLYRPGDGDLAPGDIALAENSVLVGNASGVAAANTGLARARLTEDALQSYVIPLHMLRAADGASLGVSDTEGSGDHYLTVSSNTIILRGNSPNSNTQTDTSWFQFALPPEYVAAGDITARVNCKYTAAPDTAGTIDVTCFKVTKTTGAVGSDICATAAQNLAASSTATDFTITPTGLAAGDLLNISIVTAFQDQNGTAGEAEIGSVEVLLDVKG